MKSINILSFKCLINTQDQLLISDFSNYYGFSLKEHERNDFASFVSLLYAQNQLPEIFDYYFVGLTIPQIGKEFDILRFGENSIVNIELKSEFKEEKLQNQLVRNNYYLEHLNRDIYCFGFVGDQNKLYTLNEDDKLVECSFIELVSIIKSQFNHVSEDAISLFNPVSFLISPLNATEDFIYGKYFLTSVQEKAKKEIKKNLTEKKGYFASISGEPGTGKTLLTFDIAKDMISLNFDVLVIHCGILNEGHYKLNHDYFWDIIAIKDLRHKKLSKYSLIIVDETQRIYPEQLRSIINTAKQEKINCLFSFDHEQCLKNQETRNNIPQLIENETGAITFSLKEKIRTNIEISSFISGLFDLGKTKKIASNKNVLIRYFDNDVDAISYIESLESNKEWKIINYTPSNWNCYPYDKFHIANTDTAHSVIGQEFDNVIAIIDEYFNYREGRLILSGYNPHYNPSKMLYQIMTRTRKKLLVIVVNNKEVLKRSLDILSAAN